MFRVFLISGLFALTLAWAQACSGPHDSSFACAYPEAGAGSDGKAEIVGFPKCGNYDAEGNPVFTVEQQQRIRKAAQDKLICVYTGSEQGRYRAFYVYNERRLETVFYDNGCDYYSEGLVRVFDKDKTAFADQQLNIVLRPGTILAEPFHDGHALVCDGNIKFEKVDGHVVQTGGVCGLIDHQGKLVVPMDYPHDAGVFEQYIIAHNGCNPPPINTPEQALCHAVWQARQNDYLAVGDFKHKIVHQGEMWQVILYPEDEQVQVLIEVQGKTGQLIILQRQPVGQTGTNM